jgi:hypothetical protein
VVSGNKVGESMRKPAKRTKSKASLKGARANRARAKRAGAKRAGARRAPAKSKVKRTIRAKRSSKSKTTTKAKLKRVAKNAATAGMVAAGMAGVGAALKEFTSDKKDQSEAVPSGSATPSEGDEKAQSD